MKIKIDYQNKRFVKRTLAVFIILIFPVLLFGQKLNFNYHGAVLKKKDAQKETYVKKNGTVIDKYEDKEIAVLKDKTKITRYKDGKREILTPKGVKIYIDYDGSTRYLYPNGKEKKISMDGRTPYGSLIKQERRIVSKGAFRAVVVYSSMMSDDDLRGHTKIFFNHIVKQIERWVYSKRVPGVKMRIIVSNCRFGVIGFCKRKNKKELAVISYKNDKKDRETSLQYEEILNKKNHVKLAVKVVRDLFQK
ncbi:MAG: hypothetical protein GY754_25850 [bacterium]|nr:hypothetical protein [bacterium]